MIESRIFDADVGQTMFHSSVNEEIELPELVTAVITSAAVTTTSISTPLLRLRQNTRPL